MFRDKETEVVVVKKDCLPVTGSSVKPSIIVHLSHHLCHSSLLKACWLEALRNNRAQAATKARQDLAVYIIMNILDYICIKMLLQSLTNGKSSTPTHNKGSEG